MTRAELISSREYWIVDIQTKLFEALEGYRKGKGLNRTQLAAELGFSKGYISQILNGDFDHRISKLVDLSLKIGLVPEVNFRPLSKAVGRRKDTALKVQGEDKPKQETLRTGKRQSDTKHKIPV